MSASGGERRDRVAVFDSGVGGLSVLREIQRLLPNQDIVYLADNRYGPYGDHSLDEVRRRVDQLTGYLIGLESQLFVIACNSASAAALGEVRRRHPGMPFVGMEPAVKPAARASDRAVIGVMATEATFQGELFASVVDRHARGVSVVARACSGLAAAIETDDPSIDGLLETYVGSLVGRGVDVIVLGCTHYPFVADRIAALAGPDVEIVDPAPAVAAQVVRVLDARGLRTPPGRSGTTTYLTTGDAGTFGARAADLLGGEVIASSVRV
jgi:glutamate racemase